MKLQTNRDFVTLAFLIGVVIAVIIGAMYDLIGLNIKMGAYAVLIVIGGLYGLLGVKLEDEQRFLVAMVTLIVSAIAAQMFLGTAIGGKDIVEGVRLWPILSYIVTLILSSGLILSLRILLETAGKGVELKK